MARFRYVVPVCLETSTRLSQRAAQRAVRNILEHIPEVIVTQDGGDRRESTVLRKHTRDAIIERQHPRKTKRQHHENQRAKRLGKDPRIDEH